MMVLTKIGKKIVWTVWLAFKNKNRDSEKMIGNFISFSYGCTIFSVLQKRVRKLYILTVNL